MDGRRFEGPNAIGNIGPSFEVPTARVERPTVADIYNQTFGPSCAQAAYDAYAAALKRDPAHEFTALMAGHTTGRRCQDGLFSRLTELFPQRPAGPILEL